MFPSPSTAILERHRFETFEATVRELTIGISDVSQLSDASNLFGCLVATARFAAILATNLALDASEPPNGNPALAEALDQCSVVASTNARAAAAAVDLIRGLVSSTRQKPMGRRTKEFSLEIDATLRRLVPAKR